MVAGAIYLVASMDHTFVTKDTTLRRACEAHAERLIATVQEETYYRDLIVYVPDDADADRIPPDFATGTTAVTNLNWYKFVPPAVNPLNRASDTTAGPASAALRNSRLIQGSLSSLLAIYNNVAGVRCAYGAHPNLTGLPLPDDLANLPNAPVTTIRLEPYRTDTGLNLCNGGPPAPPLAAAPRGASGFQNSADWNAFDLNSGTYPVVQDNKAPDDTIARMSPPVASTPIATRALPGPTTDIGVRMSARVDYTFNNVNYNCEVTQKFEYPTDRTPPPPLNRVEVTANSSIVGGARVLRDYCTMGGPIVTTANATIEVGYLNQAFEGGVQFFCKDLSFIRTPGATQPCQNGAGVQILAAQPFAASPTYFSGARDHQYNFTSDFAARLQPASAYWQPCDRVRQCGVTPAAALQTPNQDSLFLRLTYTALPAGCSMNMEAVAVDSAGNRSTQTSAIAANKSFLELPQAEATTSTAFLTNFTVRDDEIYYPTCGNTAASTYYRNGLGIGCAGYYRCGSC